MRYLLLLPLLFLGCSSKKPAEKTGPTYRECLAKQVKERAERFDEMPASLRALAGRHSVVKYFEKRPKDIAAIVRQLKSENATFNARKRDDPDTDINPIDPTPGRNRVLIAFERDKDFVFAKKDSDKLLFKMNYSKPVIGYYIPVDAIREKGKAFEGYFKSSAKIKAPKDYKGDRVVGKADIYIYLEPIDKEYMYIEWVNRDYDPADDANWKGIHAILYTADDDRYLEWEHPYFDNSGPLNPEECTQLQGK